MVGLIVLLCLFSIGKALENTDCLIKNYGINNIVCVCNAEHCDYYSPEITAGKINIITSNQNGTRYKERKLEMDKEPTSDRIVVIDRSKKYQSIYGWGGAFTDAAGININSLPPKARDHLMSSYFSGMGSKYNLCRVPMGGTDFSTHGYSYDDGPEDKELKNFKLAPEDFEYKIPLMQIARNLSDLNLKFFTSTWAAPKWMKTTDTYCGGDLRPQYYQTWADYFLKFLDAYKEQGLDFWGLTLGNEPLLSLLCGLTPIPSVGWNSESASLWVRENLGPTLRNSKFSDVKIIGIDDQRFFYPDYACDVLKNETTRNYIDGFSVHWYMDTILPPTRLSETHEIFPDKFILVGEASSGFLPWNNHVDLGSWTRGESYARDIIENLNNWVNGWVDWNLVLDLEGGPTYIQNFVDSPIIVNATAGEFYKQPMYYAIGHFSKFIPENSRRIDSSSNFNDTPLVAFETPDTSNNTVIVILNTFDVPTTLSVQDGSSYINLILEGKSISTVVY